MKLFSLLNTRVYLVAALLLGVLTACPEPLKPQINKVTVTSNIKTVNAAGTVELSVLLEGINGFSPAVVWSITTGEGLLSATSGSSISFTAPSLAASSNTTIRATSVQDSSKFGEVTVNNNAIGVISSTISKVTASAALTTLQAGAKTTLNVTVTGTADFDNSVLWSLKSGQGTLSATTGSSITFTAPVLATANTTVVRVTSVQDSAKFSEITINTGSEADALPMVEIISPNADLITRNSVNIELSVSGNPDTVELLNDGAVLSVLAKPYIYTLDALKNPDKTYSISARATKKGNSVLSAVKKITLDRYLPELRSFVPKTNAENVFLADEISGTFSEPLMPSSVNADTVKLKIGDVVIPTKLELSSDNTKIVIAPTVLPALPAKIDMVFSGVKDRAGNTMMDQSTYFNAPDWYQLPTIGIDYGKYNFAIDENDNVFYGFVASDQLYVKKWDGKKLISVGSSLNVPNGDEYFLARPVIALDKNGNPIVAWSQSITTGIISTDIYVKKWDGTNWVQLGERANINYPNSSTASFPNYLITDLKMVLDSTGNPILSWVNSFTVQIGQSSFTGKAEMVVYKWNEGSWNQLGTKLFEIPAVRSFFDIFNSYLKIDSNDTIYVVYKNTNSLGESVQPDTTYAWKFNGSEWIQFGNWQYISIFNKSFHLDAQGNMFAYATINKADGKVRLSFMKWDGTQWNQVSSLIDQNFTTTSFKMLYMNKNNTVFLKQIFDFQADTGTWLTTFSFYKENNSNLQEVWIPKTSTRNVTGEFLMDSKGNPIFMEVFNGRFDGYLTPYILNRIP